MGEARMSRVTNVILTTAKGWGIRESDMNTVEDLAAIAREVSDAVDALTDYVRNIR